MTETEVDDENDSAPKPRYYTPDDVALHNCAEDCWLSLFGQVWFRDERKLPRPPW